MDSNINIYLNSNEENGTPSNPITPGSTPNLEEPTKQKEQSSNGANISATAVGTYIAKQGIQKVSQRVGQIVGNSQLQDQVNAIGTLAMYGAAIIANPVFGTAMIAVNTGFEMLDYYINKRNEEKTLSVIRARAGSSLNRSR